MRIIFSILFVFFLVLYMIIGLSIIPFVYIKKNLKKVLISLVLTVLSIIIFVISFVYLFSDEIEKAVLSKINEELKSDLVVGDIEFSIFKTFPNASVTLSNIFIAESYKHSKDTLLYAKKGQINLNLIDLINKNYEFDEIRLESGLINIKYNEEGVSNFDIFIEKNREHKDFQIHEVNLKNMHLRYNDKTRSDSAIAKIKNSKFSFFDKFSKLKIKGKFFIYDLFLDSNRYINKEMIEFNSEIVLLNDIITFYVSELQFNTSKVTNLKFKKEESQFELDFHLFDKSIKNLFDIIPEEFLSLNNHTFNAKLYTHISIIKDSLKNMSVNVDFKINNGEYKNIFTNFKLSNLSCFGSFSNGKERNLESSVLTIEDLDSDKNNGKLDGYFTISNLKKYHLDATFYSSWSLKELDKLITDDSPFKNIQGEVEGTTSYKGFISFDDNMSKYLSNSKHSGVWNFTNVFFNYKDSPLDFRFKKSQWNIENHLISIENDIINVENSDLNFNGEIENLILYAMDEKDKISITGDIMSQNTIFEELYSLKDVGSEDEEAEDFESVLVNWLDASIKFDSKEFYYNKFYSTNFSGKIGYNSERLSLSIDDIKMNAFDGEINGNLLYFENKISDIILKTNLNLTKINISNVLESLDNFGQSTLTHNNIKGLATADLEITSMWDRYDKFYSRSLSVYSNIKIENGELINFTPLYKVARFINLNDIENVKFATLENNIRVEKEKIIIPKMEIKSTALSLNLSGVHRFNNDINYKIELMLSDLLSKKVKENKSIDPEDLEEGPSGKTTIQLKMKGPMNDPKITLNKLKLKSELIDTIKEEAKEIKEIIKEDILDNSDNTNDYQEIDSGIEIEWEDEN